MSNVQQKHAARFLKMMLSWDYSSLWEAYQQGKGVIDELPAVPTKFSTIHEYKAVFEKLIIEEALAQIMQGSESADLIEPYPSVLLSSQQSGDFLESKMFLSDEQALKFGHLDMVVVTQSNPNDNDASLELHAIGHCDGREGNTTLRVKFYLSEEAQGGSAKGQERVRRMRSALNTPSSCWWVLRLANTTTICREWAAMQQVEVSPMLDVLLTAKPRASHASTHVEVPPRLLAALKAQYNESQLAAITSGLDGTPVVLIQGPPGTGKTKTILGLLSILKHCVRKGVSEMLEGRSAAGRTDENAQQQEHHTRRLWHKAAPWLAAPPNRSSLRDLAGPASGAAGDPVTAYGLVPAVGALYLGSQRLTKSRVLVCAPSNSAVDEVVRRVLSSGLMNDGGGAVTPAIVRVGVAARMHKSVLPVSLEHLTQLKLPGGADGTADRAEVEKAQASILNTADIVFSTLAFSGSAIFQKVTSPFDTVVIDEAAQALEPSCLVPLLSGVKQIFMIGDPIQLPATVISSRAVAANYQQSLFKRLQDAGYPVNMLQVQYRMNPMISQFASATFYGGKIRDGGNVLTETERPYHKYKGLGPLAMFHVEGQEVIPEGSASICNHAEADMVITLVHTLVSEDRNLGAGPLIGVISPYQSQVKLLRQKMDGLLKDMVKNVDVNTIDGFQGREKDVIIFSTVRSRVGKKSSSIGFVADERRINVGLTRARCSLIVVGHRHALARDDTWLSFLRNVSDAGAMYESKPPFKAFLQGMMKGKVQPFKLPPPKPDKSAEVPFFPGAEHDEFEADDPTTVPSKRSAKPAAAKPSKRGKAG